jgi:hypothetical protein
MCRQVPAARRFYLSINHNAKEPLLVQSKGPMTLHDCSLPWRTIGALAIGGDLPGIVRDRVASPGEDEAQVFRGQIVIDAETESKPP